MLKDFGYVSLTLNPTYPEDMGTYTCLLTNRFGQAQSSAGLTCIGVEAMLLDTQHADSLQRIGYLEGQSVHIGPLSQDRPEEFQSMEQPRFARQLVEAVQVGESQPVHLEARLLPASDPKMTIEWYHNGRPLTAAHRFRPMFDFGYVALDILYAYPEDSGTYTVVARNQLGEAQSQTQLAVGSKKSLYLDPQHPEGLERIQQLESARGTSRQQTPDRQCTGPPRFIGALADQQLREDQNLHIELKVDPVHDPTMLIEWYVNGRPLLTGSRVKTQFDFGFLSADIKGVIAEDSGEYTIRAVNAMGDVSVSCLIEVVPKAAIYSDTHHQESLSKIRQLENAEKYGRMEISDGGPQTAPVFVQPLPNQIDPVPESGALHLECQVKPVSDNSLKIEWLRDGRPIPAGT
uniref:Ig-like domain-containing protein n=1 Tax=Plectus sambesii TaxID=2011161 RepID=A0A914XE33_9BILA